MSKYEDLSDEELGAEMVNASTKGRDTGLELWRRYMAAKAELAEKPEPPIVLPPDPDPPSMSASEIIEHLESVVPTEESLLAKIGETQDMPRFGEPGFLDAWTLRDGQVHMGKRWNGLGDGPDNTNAYLRAPGKSGTYGYIDSLRVENCIVEEACRWGMRLHGVRRSLDIVDALFRGIRKEHGLYLSLCGTGEDLGVINHEIGAFCVNIGNVVFKDVASQAVQTVQRDQFWDKDASGETPNPEVDFTPGRDIRVRLVRIENGAGSEGDRASFDLSHFRSRNHIDAAAIIIDDREQAESRGFLMAQGYHGLDDDFKRESAHDKFLWRSARSKQQAVSYQDMDRIILVNGVIDVPKGSNAKITLDGCSDDFHFENVTSLNEPVRVVIDGVDAGTVDELSGAL